MCNISDSQNPRSTNISKWTNKRSCNCLHPVNDRMISTRCSWNNITTSTDVFVNVSYTSPSEYMKPTTHKSVIQRQTKRVVWIYDDTEIHLGLHTFSVSSTEGNKSSCMYNTDNVIYTVSQNNCTMKIVLADIIRIKTEIIRRTKTDVICNKKISLTL